MPATVREKGEYERFETVEGAEILVLNEERWYSLEEGKDGERVVLTDPDHERRRPLQTGRFYLLDFEEEPEFDDLPHLFLEADGTYEQILLPRGLPTSTDKQRKIIRTEAPLSKEKLEEYLQRPAEAASAERSGKSSPPTVPPSLDGIDLPADRRQIVDFAKEEGAPSEVIDQLEEMPYGRYHTMEEVSGAIGD